MFQTLFRYSFAPILHKPLQNPTKTSLGTTGRPTTITLQLSPTTVPTRSSCSLLEGLLLHRTALLMPPAQITRTALALAQAQALALTLALIITRP